MEVTIIATSGLLWFTPARQEKNIVQVPENYTVRTILKQLQIPADEVSYIVHDGKIDNLDYKPQHGDVIELYPVISSG